MDRNLNLQVKPEWDEIENVRRRYATFLQEHGVSSDSIDALSMVTCELMENAVKYGAYDGGEPPIRTSLAVTDASITIEVSSPIKQEDDAQMARLDHMIQWIRGYQDPYQAYLMRLKEVSSQHMSSTESGLGLVRIAYEGQSVLDFFVDDRGVVNISAQYARESGGAR